MQLGSMFISNCNNTLHVSYTQFHLVRKPSTLDALTGYFTPSHVKHQRLLLQFLSAHEDDANSVRNMWSIIAVTIKHAAKLHRVGSLYILCLKHSTSKETVTDDTDQKSILLAIVFFLK
jgi:hypothetical protein